MTHDSPEKDLHICCPLTFNKDARHYVVGRTTASRRCLGPNFRNLWNMLPYGARETLQLRTLRWEDIQYNQRGSDKRKREAGMSEREL